ncbi:uncharacterized protein METZ01_LOCUS201602, partial [marine metagenome]
MKDKGQCVSIQIFKPKKHTGGMIMRRVFYFSGMLLCLFFMSSCAGVGALVTITAFGVEGYEEARVHRPDLKLEPLSSFSP